MLAILKGAFVGLEAINGSDVVVAIGNTGCGKSTLLTSLVFGTEALRLKKYEYQIEKILPNGQKRISDRHKWVVEQKNPLDTFTIGHSSSESMTFFPHFIRDPNSGIIFADIAGLLDSDGELIQFVNCLINRSIF